MNLIYANCQTSELKVLGKCFSGKKNREKIHNIFQSKEKYLLKNPQIRKVLHKKTLSLK